MLFSTYAGAEHASGPKPLGSPTRESDRQAGRFGLGYALSSTYVSAVLNSSTVTSPFATSTPSSVITQPGMSTPGQASPSEAQVRARASAPANRTQSSTRHQDSPQFSACCGPSYSPALQKPEICARILLLSGHPPFAGAGHEPASRLQSWAVAFISVAASRRHAAALPRPDLFGSHEAGLA